MSRGLGRIERECLRVIAKNEAAGKPSTTIDIGGDVYETKRDRRGRRTINDAQHAAVRRALTGLRRKGLVKGQQALMQHGEGGPMVLARVSSVGHAVRSCYWSTPARPDLDSEIGDDPSHMKSNVRIAFEIGVSVTTMRTARAKTLKGEP
jgi:hypothetical protein